MMHKNNDTIRAACGMTGTISQHLISGSAPGASSRVSFVKALAYLDDQLNTRLSLSEVLDE
ncbi:MAG: hypothetical protein D6758_13200 [Gammaproteobacteria bacterium]|nr:MAG: hypothetical protein D6758_13200 [Gammaproteobacteria bacterium]